MNYVFEIISKVADVMTILGFIDLTIKNIKQKATTPRQGK